MSDSTPWEKELHKRLIEERIGHSGDEVHDYASLPVLAQGSSGISEAGFV